jgi:hypothetical protein
MFKKGIAAGVLGNWRRWLGGVVAGLVLLPVPAMALTFSGSWQAVVQRQGIPIPPRPIFTDNHVGAQDNLTVNMGDYQSRSANATSSIELTRRFSISSPTEQIKLEDVFSGQFANSGVKLSVAIKDPRTGRVLRTPLAFQQQIRSTSFSKIDAEITKFLTLRRGRYLLDVKIIYQSHHRRGGWQTISPHQFEFVAF